MLKLNFAAAIAAAALTGAAADAQPARRGAAPQQLPIQQGYYVADFDRCGDTMSVFRYDGRRIGWYAAQRQPNEMEPIRSVRREGRDYLVEIANRDPDAGSGAVTTVMIAPRGQGRIAVEVQEQIPMRLCTPASLPRWMRGR